MKWAQQDDPSSHWTIGLANRWFLVCLGVLTILHFWMATLYVPTVEETLLLTSRIPLLPSLIGRSARFVAGEFGARYVTVVLGSCTLWLLARLLKRYTLAAFLMLTPLFVYGPVFASATVYLLFFWLIYFQWFVAALSSLSEWSEDPMLRVYRSEPVPLWHWALGSLPLAMGILSSQTMFLSAFFSLLTLLRFPLKAWWRGYFLQLLLAGVFTLPQWLSAPANTTQYFLVSAAPKGLPGLGRFYTVLAVTLGFLIFTTLPSLWVRWKDFHRSPLLSACTSFFLIPFLVFSALSMAGFPPYLAAVVLIPSVLPLAERALEHGFFKYHPFRFLTAVFALPFVATWILAIHSVWPSAGTAKAYGSLLEMLGWIFP